MNQKEWIIAIIIIVVCFFAGIGIKSTITGRAVEESYWSDYEKEII
ncbi:unnamed protein product, partial [marine sediment metagenome]